MEGEDAKREQQGDDLKDFLEKQGKQEIRKKASKIIGEENMAKIKALCYNMKDLKGTVKVGGNIPLKYCISGV